MPLPQPAGLTGPDDIRAIQHDRLTWTLRQARRSPFYGRLLDGVADPTDLDDLPALPQTTKAHLRDQYPFGLLAVRRSLMIEAACPAFRERRRSGRGGPASIRRR